MIGVIAWAKSKRIAEPKPVVLDIMVRFSLEEYDLVRRTIDELAKTTECGPRKKRFRQTLRTILKAGEVISTIGLVLAVAGCVAPPPRQANAALREANMAAPPKRPGYLPAYPSYDRPVQCAQGE